MKSIRNLFTVRKLLTSLFFLSSLLLLSAPARAQASYSLPVGWTSTSASNNWKIYISSGTAPFSTLNPTNVQNAVSTPSGTNFQVTATLNGLALNVPNRLYVTAVDKVTGLESPPSNVLTNSVVIPSAPLNFTVTGPITIQGPITINGISP